VIAVRRRQLGVVRVLVELALVAAVILLAARPGGQSHSWRPHVVYRVPTQEKVVALTFDDGPHPEFTPEVLDILKKENVKATFFMIGERMEKYPEIVKEVMKQGHLIGNHTYTHPSDIEADTQAQVIRELEKCEEVIER
jgi:peptidoglycan/xylan/chitin deacetylase (PgdA/CDA1 family)